MSYIIISLYSDFEFKKGNSLAIHKTIFIYIHLAGTILALKVLASFGLVSYTVAMATGFLALCWIKEKRQRLFYVSVVCSIIAGGFKI